MTDFKREQVVMAPGLSSFTPEQDEALKTAFNNYDGPYSNKWVTIAESVPGKNNKQCSERWRRIKPVTKEVWEEEDMVKVARVHAVTPLCPQGTNWVAIAAAAGFADRGPNALKDMCKSDKYKIILQQVVAELAEGTAAAPPVPAISLKDWGEEDMVKVARAQVATPLNNQGRTDWVSIAKAAGVEDRGKDAVKHMCITKTYKSIYERVKLEMAAGPGSAVVPVPATIVRVEIGAQSERESDAPRKAKQNRVVTDGDGGGGVESSTKKKSKSKQVADVDSSSGNASPGVSSSRKRKETIGAADRVKKKKKKKSLSASSSSSVHSSSSSSGSKRGLVSSDDDEVIPTKTKKTKKSSHASGKRSASGTQKTIKHSWGGGGDTFHQHITKELSIEDKETMERILDISVLPSPTVLQRLNRDDDKYNKRIEIDEEELMAQLRREGLLG